jgi:hypothetical protein
MLRDTVLSSNVLTSIYSNDGQGCTAFSDREIEIVPLASVIIACQQRESSQFFAEPHSFHVKTKDSGDNA